MINELDFNGSQPLRDSAQKAVHAIVKLRDAADQARVPVVYVNDNNDQWHSDRERLIKEAFGSGQVTDDIVARLRPRDDDFFVIKPQFSGFYATNLQVLLPRLKASRLILTGVAADICVLFTAADAHMRDYELWVPEDGVASLATKRTAWALDLERDDGCGNSQHCRSDHGGLGGGSERLEQVSAIGLLKSRSVRVQGIVGPSDLHLLMVVDIALPASSR
jgi:nicotinamidase-related amidase